MPGSSIHSIIHTAIICKPTHTKQCEMSARNAVGSEDLYSLICLCLMFFVWRLGFGMDRLCSWARIPERCLIIRKDKSTEALLIHLNATILCKRQLFKHIRQKSWNLECDFFKLTLTDWMACRKRNCTKNTVDQMIALIF